MGAESLITPARPHLVHGPVQVQLPFGLFWQVVPQQVDPPLVVQVQLYAMPNDTLHTVTRRQQINSILFISFFSPTLKIPPDICSLRRNSHALADSKVTLRECVLAHFDIYSYRGHAPLQLQTPAEETVQVVPQQWLGQHQIESHVQLYTMPSDTLHSVNRRQQTNIAFFIVFSLSRQGPESYATVIVFLNGCNSILIIVFSRLPGPIYSAVGTRVLNTSISSSAPLICASRISQLITAPMEKRNNEHFTFGT